MNLQFYLEKLDESDEFKEFVKEMKTAYLCSGYFSVDKEGKENKQNLDFYVPATGKFYSFDLSGDVKKAEIESFGKDFIPEGISVDLNFDFDEMEDLIVEKMAEEKVTNKVQKIFYSLQQKDGKPSLIVTVFISGMGLLKIIIDIKAKKVTAFEKKSLFDMFKIVKK
jgi:hypothetical protein